MNDKIKNILKIATLWLFAPLFLVCLLEIITGGQFDSFNNVGEVFVAIFLLVCYYLFPLFSFIPTIILLCFLCKRLKTTWIKILLISFAIPFTNMIYFFIEEVLAEKIWNYSALLSVALGFFSLIILIILFGLTLITPKRWLALKKEFLLTEVCMFGFACILISLTFFITDIIHNHLAKKALNSYQPAIQYIENYRKENSKYPKNIDKFEFSAHEQIPDFEYKTYDNNDGFVLKVFNKSPDYYCYRYCSNEKYEGCKEETTSTFRYIKFGDWIKMSYID